MNQDHGHARRDKILQQIKGRAEDLPAAIDGGRIPEEFHGILF